MDPKIRQRTIDHMNRDHQAELAHYLEFYSGVDRWVATSNPEMVDMTLDAMVVRAGDGTDHRIVFDPPLASAADSRRRLIDMDVVAREALSDDRLTVYAPPTGVGAAVFGSVVFYIVCWLTLPRVTPGTEAWRLLTDYWPGGPDVYRSVVQLLFWPTLLIHIVETAVFDRVRMARYRVPRFSRLWWLWSLNCLIEGFPTFKRVDAIMKAKMQAGKKE
ncbi:Protein of unknown function (DUF2470) [Geosmithia morbida]|uniref:DUF2470 domain-containing protein n=1 Tax=Geosmithia morbida TaxID=1094350 RepID=A0A9P5D196_9HYPO|nr:Protein of unknown function (DUF2470) [Geosmithia morbida]KAF4123648.1 Protein of unknown function (DUF2470) [Geosmithia morbida]